MKYINNYQNRAIRNILIYYGKYILPPSPSFVYFGRRGLGTHSNALVKCSSINYFEFFFLLNKNLMLKFYTKKENFKNKL